MTVRHEEICGGITSPQGFVAGSVYCGIKESNASKPDLALIYSPGPAVAAATFTTNRVKAAPVRVSSTYLKTEDIRAVVANSGNANACTGVNGIAHAKRMCDAVAAAFSLERTQVLVCSTGRIGMRMPIEKIEEGIAKLPKEVRADGSLKAAKAIMTSDTVPKEVAVKTKIGGREIRIGGIAKGAGMIDPNMATMLAFLTTDAPVPKATLQRMLASSVEQSFNRITIDGDMSTNDTVILLANGEAGGAAIEDGAAAEQFQAALDFVTRKLSWMIVEDGEGATKFIEVLVKGARTVRDARRAAEAIANSTLVKCAWYGGDANWGRIMDAIGYCGAKMREEMVDIYYDGVLAVQNGMAGPTPYTKLLDVVRQPRFTITVDLNFGLSDYSDFTTDLTAEYVKFNMGE